MTSRSPSNRHSGCEADSGREAASHSKVDSHRRKSSDRMAGRRFSSRSARRCREDSRRADAHRRRQRNCRPASLSPSDHCSGGETDRRHAISREADGCLDRGEDGHLEPAGEAKESEVTGGCSDRGGSGDGGSRSRSCGRSSFRRSHSGLTQRHWRRRGHSQSERSARSEPIIADADSDGGAVNRGPAWIVAKRGS